MKEGQRYLRTYFVIILDVFKRVVGAVSQCLLLLNLVPRVFVPLDQRVGLRETLG